ncbi:MAG: sodium:solute symporter family protein [Ferrovum sp.]|nr:sodium:solute symporter family protein [Ferrovum sp.]
MHGFGLFETAVIVIMVIAYILFTTWLTLKLRSRTSGEFMYAARSLPAFVVGVLMMSEFIGAKSTIGAAQTAFESGLAASWAVLSAAIGFALFGILLSRKFYHSGEFTISGAIGKKYGRSTQLTVSLIMIYALLLVNVGYYVSGAAAVSVVLRVSLPMAAIITALVCTFYCAIGGLKSVAYVSLLHTFVKYAGVLIILVVALTMTHGVLPMVSQMPNFYFTWDGKIGPATLVAWIIANVGAVFSTQYIVQAISSVKNPDHVRRSTYVAALLCIPISIMIGLIGVAAKFLFPDIKSLYAIPVFLDQMNFVLAGFVTMSLVASVFVGVSSITLAISSLVMNDFYVPLFRPTPQTEFKMARLLSIPIGFLPLIFVFFVPHVLQLSFFTRALRLSIAIVAMMAFYLPFFQSGRGATLGLMGAAIGTTVWYLLDDPYGIDNIYIALTMPPIIMMAEKFMSVKRVLSQS